MAADQPESRVTGGIRTLEVRWILPGELAAPVAGWFGRFTGATESRQDAYLLPHLPGLSVKIRDGTALEVKVYQGSPGVLEVAGRARGRMESWQKWSFPCGRPGQGSGDVAGCWRPVHKRRRIGWFPSAGEPAMTGVPGPGEKTGCAVELTEVLTRGEAWWTLAFEAAGPADLLRSQLEATAELVLAQALPGEVELSVTDSMSYAEWLWRRIASSG